MKVIKQMWKELCEWCSRSRWFIAAMTTLIAAIVWAISVPSAWEVEQQAREARGENVIQDNCTYQTAMLACLEKLPQGAERLTAAGNDWDEVAEVCKDFARSASYRQAKNVKEECR